MTPTTRDFEKKEREYEDQVASRYNRDYHEAPIMQWQNEAFVSFIGRHYKPGDRVLDLGCGPASIWGLLKEHLPAPSSLVGVDLSSGMIEEANRLEPDGDFRIGSMFSIPAGAGEFDLVIVSSAFHHVPDSELPFALKEISRVMDEHAVLVGREPLATGRVGDRGGWLAGALMNLRHLTYRVSHTREYPEPDPGPAHHAYVASEFFDIVGTMFAVTEVQFRNPVSPFLARVRDKTVSLLAKLLDESIGHKEGQEVHYAAAKNFVTGEDVQLCVRRVIEENKIQNIEEFLALIEASSRHIEDTLGAQGTKRNKKFNSKSRKNWRMYGG
jgi:ubiquinone/menaquinone biosynthesis C-methylase UbiE